jgi:hypothetical protein
MTTTDKLAADRPTQQLLDFAQTTMLALNPLNPSIESTPAKQTWTNQ